jgi:hypothetical protein
MNCGVGVKKLKLTNDASGTESPELVREKINGLNDVYQANRSLNFTFENFYLIKPAVELSDKNGNLPIFSLDKDKPKIKGAKSFFVSGYKNFWIYYKKLDPQERCFYETILPDQLCHLYADIEGSKETNPNVNFELLYNNLMVDLQQFVKTFLNIDIQRRITIYDPDSSTVKKFSKHCIIKIDEGYFRNNYHCGAFMRQFQKYIIEKYGDPSISNNPYYIVSDKIGNNDKIFLLDLGVYTLRRQFRLLGSSKRITPRRPLLLNGETSFTEQQFFDCLIQYIPDTNSIKNIFYVTETNGSQPTSCSLRTFDNNGNTVSVSGEVSGGSHNHMVQTIITRQPSRAIIANGVIDKSSAAEVYNRNSLPSFVQQILRKYFKETYNYEITNYCISNDKIKFDCNDTRCLNKLKVTGIEHHRSNHVYFIVFPESKFHFQGCYDQDSCKVGNKPSITPLGQNGYIVDEKVVKALDEWWWKQHKNIFSWTSI